MLVREDMGAHTAYERKRFLAELLFLLHETSSPVLPWACSDDPEKQSRFLELTEDSGPKEVDKSNSQSVSDGPAGHVSLAVSKPRIDTNSAAQLAEGLTQWPED